MAGIALRLIATALFTVMSVAVRFASEQAPTGQIMFWRSAVALIPITVYLMLRGQFPAALVTHNPAGHVKRSLIGGASMFFSFVTLAYLPVAPATALMFLAPLVAIPAGIFFLGERPGAIVTLAAVVGFLGVGLMLAPAMSGQSADVGVAIGVGAGIVTAITTVMAKVHIKRLTMTEKPGTIAFYFAIICSVIGLATWPFGWATTSGHTLFWLAMSGFVGGCAHIAMTEALARAPVSTLAPFEYTALPLAFAADILLFGIAPTWLGLVGSTVIVLAAASVAFSDVIAARLAPKVEDRGRCDPDPDQRR
jgi:drug/metabolite transporter (DMT)-like permease